MSRFKKISFSLYGSLLFYFPTYFIIFIIVGARLDTLKNQAIMLTYVFFLFIFLGVILLIPTYLFFDLPFRKDFKSIKKVAKIHIKLDIPDNKKSIKLSNQTILFYKEFCDFRALSVHKITTLDTQFCRELIKDTKERTYNIFSRSRDFRYSDNIWQSNVNVFYCLGDDMKIDDVEKIAINFISDKSYWKNNLCCFYSPKDEILLIKEFSNNLKFGNDYSFLGYRRCIKFFCKIFGVSYKELTKYL